jgi:Ca2+-binding EF-hand superfamily protein
MKTRLLLIPLGLAVALVMSPTPEETQAQFPQQPQFQGGQGGFGGPGGVSRGGQGFDPNAFFDRYANGKDVIIRDQLDASGQNWFDRTAQRMGLTGGTMTRQQFTNYMQDRMAGRTGGGGPGGPPPGGAPSQPVAPPAANPDADATAEFQRRDRNGDGYLDMDEMPGSLRRELSTWDRNNDGRISLTEYQAYYRARQQQMQQGGMGPRGARPLIQFVPAEEEVKRPQVYRAGNLPAQMPTWFAEFDANQDGQISLYEWRSNPYGWSDHDFFAMDTNNDGFITVEEFLRYQGAQAKLASSANRDGYSGPVAAAMMAPSRGPGSRNRSPGGWNGPAGGFSNWQGSTSGYDGGPSRGRGRGGPRDDSSWQGGNRSYNQSGYDRPPRNNGPSDGSDYNSGRGRRQRDG